MSETLPEAPAKSQSDLRDTATTNYPVLRNKKLLAAVEEFVAISAQLKALKKRHEELRDQVIAGMNGSPVAYAGARTVNVATVAATPATPDRVITKDMMGQVLRGSPAKSSYQQLRVA